MLVFVLGYMQFFEKRGDIIGDASVFSGRRACLWEDRGRKEVRGT